MEKIDFTEDVRSKFHKRQKSRYRFSTCYDGSLESHGIVSREWFSQLWVTWYHPRVSSRYSSNSRSEEIRTSVSRLSEVSKIDRENEVRRAQDYVTRRRRIGCPLVLPPEEELSWPPTTDPTSVKTHQISVYVYTVSIKIHENIFAHFVREVSQRASQKHRMSS